jgi:ABC-type transporter Mla subunit MlaD
MSEQLDKIDDLPEKILETLSIVDKTVDIINSTADVVIANLNEPANLLAKTADVIASELKDYDKFIDIPDKLIANIEKAGEKLHKISADIDEQEKELTKKQEFLSEKIGKNLELLVDTVNTVNNLIDKAQENVEVLAVIDKVLDKTEQKKTKKKTKKKAQK